MSCNVSIPGLLPAELMLSGIGLATGARLMAVSS
jgi:hypothetical protein